ncbi:Palmitoyltransferase [Hexamita inflata]|uniref:Palmitoyltransferase n=1 Tax=Hexamita inflata TaxID=28002 RepID=A0AA86U6C1_9EUKA|nr:Palmitoyltransferase [Hexamita inflata]
MIKIGNVRVSNNGKYILGVDYYKSIISAILILIPALITGVYIQFSVSIIYLNWVVVVVTFVTTLLSLVFLTLTSIIEPGILPGKELQMYFLNQIEQLIKSKQKSKSELQISQRQQFFSTPDESTHEMLTTDNKKIFRNSQTYQILSDRHDEEDHEFTVRDKGHSIPLKYCATCGFYRPLRCVHGSKSSVCIQRYDHFCVWVGTDVGLHNHGYFLLLLFFTCVHFVFQVIFGVLGIICGSFLLSKPLFLKSLPLQYLNSLQLTASAPFSISTIVLSSVITIISFFAIRLTSELLSYHHTLLQTGTLTKEDSGPQNALISAAFNKLSLRKNIQTVFQGLKTDKILSKFIKEQNELIKVVRENILVDSFDAIGRTLKMKMHVSFQDLQKRDQVKKKMSRACQMFEEEKPQQILEKIEFNQVITARNAFEFGLTRSRQGINNSKTEVERLKQARPEMFVWKEKKELMIVQICQKKPKTPKQEKDKDKNKGQTKAEIALESRTQI